MTLLQGAELNMKPFVSNSLSIQNNHADKNKQNTIVNRYLSVTKKTLTSHIHRGEVMSLSLTP